MTAPHEHFRSRQRHVALSGLGPVDLDMAFTDVGEGEPVVLLHGIPTWSFLFADAIPVLADHCRVLAVDMLGHGWSDRRDRFDRSLPAQARAVLRLLDVLGIERATVVGHDTGGGVAQVLAVEHPDRLDRLVLVDAVAYDSWPVEDMIALGDPRWRDKPSQEVAAFVAQGLADGLAHAERLTPAFVEGIVAPWSDSEGAISLIRNASALNTNHTMELVGRHCDIRTPTLVLWGIHDPWQPLADGQRLAREIPGARIVELDASHWVPHDAPDRFAAAVLDFLSATPVPSASG